MPEVVVQIVQHLRPGGLEVVALDLARSAPPGTEVHLVSLEGEAPAAVAAWPRLRELGDRLHMLGKPAGLAPPLVPRLARLLRRLRATAVETHHIGPLLYGGAAARLAGVRRLVHVEHDAWHLEDAKAARLHRTLVAVLRPRLVAVGEVVARSLHRHLGRYPVAVIANGVDTERFRPGDVAAARRRLGLPETATMVGCAARLEPVKGHADLLSAAARLPDDVHLALAGDGSLASSLREQAGRLGLAGRVHFLGKVDDMPLFYRSLDRFCLASHAEGLPLAPLEAQSSGVPVVVTEVGGAPEAVCPATGRLAPAHDPAGLAMALAASLAQPPRLDPRAFVVARHELRRVADAHYALLAA
jgi:glycosyltransferase involved in cell wall biosynthesis